MVRASDLAETGNRLHFMHPRPGRHFNAPIETFEVHEVCFCMGWLGSLTLHFLQTQHNFAAQLVITCPAQDSQCFDLYDSIST